MGIVCIIAGNLSEAEHFAHANDIPDNEWGLIQEDFDFRGAYYYHGEEPVRVVFTGSHHDLPIDQWFALRKQVEQYVIEGKATWYWQVNNERRQAQA